MIECKFESPVCSVNTKVLCLKTSANLLVILNNLNSIEVVLEKIFYLPKKQITRRLKSVSTGATAFLIKVF